MCMYNVPRYMDGSPRHRQLHPVDDGQSRGEQEEVEMVRGEVEELSLGQETDGTQQ